VGFGYTRTPAPDRAHARVLSLSHTLLRTHRALDRLFALSLTHARARTGYSIGSANWTLASSAYSVAIIGASCLSPILRHPLPLQLQHLGRLDVAIFGDLLPRQRIPDQGMGAGAWPSLGRIVSGVKATVQDGGVCVCVSE
jgi:hypothetical protein